MKKQTLSYQRHQFASEIISHAVWLYHRYLEVGIFAELRVMI
jgi:transposase-like protein